MAWTAPMVDTLPEIQADTRSIAEAPHDSSQHAFGIEHCASKHWR